MSKKHKTKGGANHSALIESVAKSFGSDYVGTFTGDNQMDLVEEWIPSTNMAVNYICGDPIKGALPQGRIIEIFGPKSSAKSLLLYDFIMNVQKAGGVGVLIDSESAFSKNYGKYLGIDFNSLIYAQLRTIEEVTDFVAKVITEIRDKDSNCPVLIGWDSLAACTTIKEDEAEEADNYSEMGYRARLMGRQMRKVGGSIFRDNITYVVINQIRKKLGIRFGKTTTTPGGESLPFHASLRIEVNRSKKLKKSRAGNKVVIGHKVIVYCDKNKVRPPFGTAEINVYVDRSKMRYGLDKWSGMLEVLEQDGIISISKGIATLNSDTSIKFNTSNIADFWDSHILPAIPEDLYKPVVEDTEESEEEEESDE